MLDVNRVCSRTQNDTQHTLKAEIGRVFSVQNFRVTSQWLCSSLIQSNKFKLKKKAQAKCIVNEDTVC